MVDTDHNTDYSIPVIFQHLSPTFMRQLDQEAGEVWKKNGGNFEFRAQWQGRARPVWYEVAYRMLPWKKRSKS